MLGQLEPAVPRFAPTECFAGRPVNCDDGWQRFPSSSPMVIGPAAEQLTSPHSSSFRSQSGRLPSSVPRPNREPSLGQKVEDFVQPRIQYRSSRVAIHR